MTTLTIDIEPDIEEQLRRRAAEHGHSVEAEARRILASTLSAASPENETNLYDRIRRRFEPLGGVELELPSRQPARDPPSFD